MRVINHYQNVSRRIARIDYDLRNNPIRIQFTDGNVTRYVYSATGEKLRVIYQTAVPNITVAIGSTRELMPSEILFTDSTDYLLGGALTLKNGRIDMYQFDEGYCQATQYNATQDNFTFLYYDRDHLGNVRQVTKAMGSTGTVMQTMNYYPFGAQFCDGSAASGDVQPYKYNGKELDKMHGLNTYDYGARQYNPVTARWDRMDPLAEKYSPYSPYMYCLGNPIKYVDPDGRDAWVLTWATQSSDATGTTRIGHTGIVVENFNSSYESKGTYTYYDLWPSAANLGGKAAVQNVDAVYNSQSFYILTNGEKNVDYSALERYMSEHDMSQLPGMLQNNISENSINGYGEGYAPDGIIRLGLDGQQSYQLQKEYISLIQQGEPYNGESNNCTTFVAKGINNSGVGTIKEESIIDWRGLFINFNPFHKSFTPNATYNQLKNRTNSVIIKSAGNKTNESYEDAIIDR